MLMLLRICSVDLESRTWRNFVLFMIEENKSKYLILPRAANSDEVIEKISLGYRLRSESTALHFDVEPASLLISDLGTHPVQVF